MKEVEIMKMSLRKLTNEKILFALHGLGFVFVCLFGMYSQDVARNFPNFITKILLPANYSLWEQGKILLTGMSLWFIIEYILVGRKIKGFISIHTLIAVVLPAIMLIVYMTHSTLFGGLSLEGAHIALAVMLILTGFLASVIMTVQKKDYSVYAAAGVVIYVIVIIVYVIFTFLPPQFSIFYDEINSSFGPIW